MTTSTQTQWYTETINGQSLSFEYDELLYEKQSDWQKVTIINTLKYGCMLLLDGMVMTTEKDEFVYHEMISHIPLLSHPNPQKVLVIGGGDGGTIREVLRHPNVEHTTLCEIDGDVIEVCKQFLPSIASDLLTAENNPRITVNVDDGIAFIKQYENEFDVIIVDSSDPEGFCEGLFGEDFYRDCYKALKPDGILTAQTDSPYHEEVDLAQVYSAYKRIFPIVQAYIGHIPTYPGGLWTWSYCSKQYLPEIKDLNKAQAIEKQTQYYNSQIHMAAFSLPNFLKDKIIN